MDSISTCDQRELINELLEDSDFTDPLEYFDQHDALNLICSTPASPNDPGMQILPQWNAPQLVIIFITYFKKSLIITFY